MKTEDPVFIKMELCHTAIVLMSTGCMQSLILCLKV